MSLSFVVWWSGIDQPSCCGDRMQRAGEPTSPAEG
jgi:hypothetical protein